MTLRDAITYAQVHGGCVVYGTPPDWSEYSTQHMWGKDGTLHWTAGMTVGGVIPQPWEQDRRFTGQLDRPGFEVYTEWRGSQIVTPT